MKKLLFVIVVLALLLSNVNFVSASSNPCDAICVEKVLENKLSDSEIQRLGYANVVLAVTTRLSGNLQGALYLTGLGTDTFAANANANAIFGINLNGEVEGLVLCGPEDAPVCPADSIWGYTQTAPGEYTIYVCSISAGCKEEYLP